MAASADSEILSLSTRVSEELLGVEEEPEEQGLIIEKPFDPDLIKVTTEKKTIDLIVRRIRHSEIDLAPEFQRRARLWHPHRKSQLIESLLLKIPLPVFYVAADKEDNWAVVDGLQRITTIYDFIDGQFPLAGLEYLKPLEGQTFGVLDRSLKRRIEETELVINVIQPGTPEEVMINIFKRINTGGIPLNGQEVRNALHKGPVREFLQRLAGSMSFSLATDGSIKDERMDGQEMALRFLAFKISGWQNYKVNNLDAFLNDAMALVNSMSDSDRDALEYSFNRAMRAAHGIFGKSAFRKVRPDRRSPISKPLFEAWSVNLARCSDKEIDILVDKKDEVVEELNDALSFDADFAISVSYSTGVPKRVHKRFDEIEEIILRMLS